MSFVSFAQNFEDVMLWRALGHVKDGFYVDVGAFSPDEHSVTRAFYDRGWSGINIEPNPRRVAELSAKRGRDLNLGVAASDGDGMIQLHVVADTGLTTAEASIADMHKTSGWDISIIEVPRLRLSAILDEHVAPDQPIHFLKIDVEGHEAATLRGIDLSRHRPWVILVEATVPLSRVEVSAEWEELILAAGYRNVYWDGLNRFYLAEEQSDLGPAFSVPPNIFDGFMTSELAHANSRIQDLDTQIHGVRAHAAVLEGQAQSLQALIATAEQKADLEAARANALAEQAQSLQALIATAEQKAGLQAARAQSLQALVMTAEQKAGEEAARANALTEQARSLQALIATAEQKAGLQAARAQSLQALLESETNRAMHAEALSARVSIENHYMANRSFWEALLFRPSGKPKKAIRRLFFHNSGKPRRVFRKWIFRSSGRPRRAFVMWLASSEYQRLPKAALRPAPVSVAAASMLPVAPVANGSNVPSTGPSRRHAGRRAEATAFGGAGASILSFVMEIGPSASLPEAENTLRSLFAQGRSGWEIVLHGDGAARLSELSRSGKGGDDARIVVATGTGAVLSATKGEFVAVLQPGDVLESDALEQMAQELAQSPDADILYSDEKVQGDHGSTDGICLKPSWSPELLYSFNYFGRLTLLRRDVVLRAGGLTDAPDLDAEWDLNLRASDAAQLVLRVPKVLCHRHAQSDQRRPAPESAANIAAQRTIEAYWRRRGFDAVAQSMADGTQSVSWPFREEPRVSIIIPTKDKAELLRVSTAGILDQTKYRNLELILVDTGSTEVATRDLYKELRVDPRVRILNFRAKFNYSSACNFGAEAATGQFLLFLNNDVEVISPDWLAAMVRVAQHPGVGCVGVKLTYPAGVLQHAGVMIGPQLAVSGYRGEEKMGFEIFGSPHHPRNWLAVTGACQMISREAFSVVGGFDEAYEVVLSDVAICVRLWLAGYRTAYVPAGELIHHEGASRGNSNSVADERRLGDDIRAAGIDEDPYLHPELDGNTPTPRLRLPSGPGPADALHNMLSLKGSNPLIGPVLDLGNDGQVAQFVDRSRDEILWPPQPAFKVDSAVSLARFTLDLLRRRPDIRARFPRALTDGADGAFGRWLSSDAVAQFGLPDDMEAHVRAMYGADYGAKARRYYFWREDARNSFPHGLTPAGRDELLRWFLQHGRYDAGLSREDVWWLFLQASECPEQELVTAFAFTTDWQAIFPDGASPFGADRFANWFSSRYRVAAPWTHPSGWPFPGTSADQIRLSWRTREDWQAVHPDALADERSARAFLDWLGSGAVHLEPWVSVWLKGLDLSQVASELCVPGLNLIGHLRYPSGLRVSAEALIEGLQACGGQVSLRDLRTDLKDDTGREQFSGFETFDVTLIHAQPEPFFANAYQRSDLSAREPHPYRIAYWYWEFDTIPDAWRTSAEIVNEVWAATEFVADGLRKKLSVPVRTIFPGVRLSAFEKRERAYFGLAEDETVFLFAFHMASIMERKNPLGLIRAFKMAFSPEEPVRLVLKTSFGDRHPAQLAELQSAASGARITIINREFPHEDVLALMETSDAYVSLHRSEGLGLTMAEAMLMGKPVIATRYSGNLEFMDDSNSLLVDFELTKLGKVIPPYEANYHWAQPSESDAAAKLRRVYEDKEFARSLGSRAKADIQSRVSPEQAGKKVLNRLNEIRSDLKSTMRGGC